MSSASEGSRLGKLLALLESESAFSPLQSSNLQSSVHRRVLCRHAAGSSLDIRKAAAEQVASIAQAHPAQLPSLLRHVYPALS
jgi:hypothetical protein